MFICNPCLEKNYENEPSIFARSYERCEFCEKGPKDCNNIPSGYLEPKRKKKKKKNAHR